MRNNTKHQNINSAVKLGMSRASKRPTVEYIAVDLSCKLNVYNIHSIRY